MATYRPEVGVVSLDAVVQDRDDDPLARVSQVPRGPDVHVKAAPRAPIQVPLVGEHWVTDKRGALPPLDLNLGRIGNGLFVDGIPERTASEAVYFFAVPLNPEKVENFLL